LGDCERLGRDNHGNHPGGPRRRPLMATGPRLADITDLNLLRARSIFQLPRPQRFLWPTPRARVFDAWYRQYAERDLKDVRSIRGMKKRQRMGHDAKPVVDAPGTTRDQGLNAVGGVRTGPPGPARGRTPRRVLTSQQLAAWRSVDEPLTGPGMPPRAGPDLIPRLCARSAKPRRSGLTRPIELD
jgi:hypothetical protein